MNLTRASLDSSHFNGNRVALATLIFYRLFFSVLSGYGTTNYEANRRCSPPTILLSLRSDCFAFACMDGLFEQLRHFRPTISVRLYTHIQNPLTSDNNLHLPRSTTPPLAMTWWPQPFRRASKRHVLPSLGSRLHRWVQVLRRTLMTFVVRSWTLFVP